MRRMAIAFVLALVPTLVGAKDRIAVFSSGVEVVKVTVSAEDDARRNVRDLTLQDFVVREDGKPQKISVFARASDQGPDENLALDLAMLFDTSESMVEVLKLSQQAATRFLQSIPRARDLLVVFFDQDLRISRFQSEQQQGLFSQIQEASSGGNTAVRDAVAVCLSRLTGARGRHAMVIFSDGEDTFSRIDQGRLAKLVRASGVTIYPIAFQGSMRSSASAEEARAFLRGLAELTGGRVFPVKTASEVPDVYRAILDDLEGQYVLGYIPQNQATDGKYRKIKIEILRKGVKVRHREGYYAPAP